jgi:Tfp pilus assembly major pilin PilA
MTSTAPAGNHRNPRFAAELGFVMPVALIVLFVVAVLTAIAIVVATQTSSSTTRDTSVKAEVEAAEAGLQVATYRLSQLRPTETECINESQRVAATKSTEAERCKDGAESLGNGATFQYWTTLPEPAGGESCGGRQVTAIPGKVQRCIAAEGIVNGVTPGVRLQVRVLGPPGEALFPIPGITGLEEFTASGGTISGGQAGSNRLIKISGGANLAHGYALGPHGTFVHEGGATWSPPEEKRSEELVSKLPANHATSTNNDDARITKGEDTMSGTAEFNSTNDELTLASNSKLTLTGSKYFFCSISTSNNSELIIPAGKQIQIFIGSPEEPSKFCPSGSGTWETHKGEFIVNNQAKDPSALLIEMFGKGPINLGNGTKLEYASIVAPGSEVILTGNTKLSGALVGAKVHLERGFSYEWNEKDLALASANAGPYSRGSESWEQCADGSGPSEGC